MAGGAFIAMLRVGAFLLLIWGASRVSRLAGISSIVLEITTGLVFSPGIVGLMPKEYAVCYYNLIDDCETQKTLNHVQQKLGGCDYDAYLTRDGFSFAALPLAAVIPSSAGDHSTTDTHDDLAAAGTGPAASATDHGSDNGTDTHGSDTPAGGHRRLFAVQEEDSEDQGTLWTGGHGRRLSGSSKGKTKYDTYEDCLLQACKMEVSHECTLTPNIFSFVGHIGVALMIFESGMHFDFDKAKVVGPTACVIAVLGTFLPLLFGTLGVMLLCGKSMYPEGISAGTALAPTSVGIALKLLNEAKQLQALHGQTIITAAFVDDILSLVLFNCLFAIGDGDIGFMTFLPAILGILGMVGILVFAGTVSQPIMEGLLKLAPTKPGRKLSPEHELLFLIMMVFLLILGTAFFFAGTHLWGCFMCGMCFAKMHYAHHVWVKQTKRVTSWMIRIFFSCTVAFSIPIDQLLSLEAFWKGSLMGIGPCIATKVFCAFFVAETRWVIGWAMVGRAEFAYLIAQLAASSGMMSPEVFSVVIWSLLWATVFAPFLFRYVLQGYVLKKAKEDAEANGEEWTAEKHTEWKQQQGSGEFRQSGHLPDLQQIDEEKKKEEDRLKEPQPLPPTSSYSLKDTNHKPVASAYESADVHQENDVLVKKETHAAAPVAREMLPVGSSKEEHGDAANAAARGSGFLCCLFFRKIVIM